MEEEPSDEGERPGYPPLSPFDDVSANVPPREAASSRPESSPLADEAAEIRRLVEAGAGSPEALRDLAARLRQHREREEELWRTEVKPALVKENKGRIRGYRSLPAAPKEPRRTSNLGTLVVLLLGLILLVLIAANTTVWMLVLPIAGLVVWAWFEGRDSMPKG